MGENSKIKARTLFKATYAGTVVGETVLGTRLEGCGVGATVGDTVVGSGVGPEVGISVVGLTVGKIEGSVVGSSDGGLVEGSSVVISSRLVGASLAADGAHEGRVVGSDGRGIGEFKDFFRDYEQKCYGGQL